LIGARSAFVDAFTGTGGSRSSRRLALPVRSLQVLNRPLILRALLFLAPYQVLSQRVGEPCFAGSPLDSLPRGDPGRLSHPAMQHERHEAVKESACCSMRSFRVARTITATSRRDSIQRGPSGTVAPQSARNSPATRVRRLSAP
jgi:hypothetical protein